MLNSSAFTAWSRTVAVAQSSAWWKFLRLGSFVLDACLGVSAWDTNSTRLLMREDWSLAESWVKSKSDPSQDDTSLWHFERKRVREADRKRTEPMASAIRMPVGYPQQLEIWCSMSLTSHYSTVAVFWDHDCSNDYFERQYIPRWWSWLVSSWGESTWSSVDLFPRLARPVGSSMMNKMVQKIWNSPKMTANRTCFGEIEVEHIASSVNQVLRGQHSQFINRWETGVRQCVPVIGAYEPATSWPNEDQDVILYHFQNHFMSQTPQLATTLGMIFAQGFVGSSIRHI